MINMTHLGNMEPVRETSGLGDLGVLETKTSTASYLVVGGSLLVAGLLIWFLVATAPSNSQP